MLLLVQGVHKKKKTMVVCTLERELQNRSGGGCLGPVPESLHIGDLTKQKHLLKYWRYRLK
jgi:hypothetical protein